MWHSFKADGNTNVHFLFNLKLFFLSFHVFHRPPNRIKIALPDGYYSDISTSSRYAKHIVHSLELETQDQNARMYGQVLWRILFQFAHC